ncbi:hypothetical protein [Winogradskyella flava]|uniref:Uncharacterized protein n=1 Tax=Winogradskyella flava TaxID=1884876 RepID=A0A842INL5_9FLAO|nr:hypothetical protein [Winogradskyella flava]MBC2844371.1 hypothetical protein [Winogradskyella flava]
MKRLFIAIGFFLGSCSQSDNEFRQTDNSLTSYIENKTFETGAVIACAGNDIENLDLVEVYFFPESNSENYRLFQTNSSNVNPNDLSNYNLVNLDSEPFFNGYLRKFVGSFSSEKWMIVSFEKDGDIKLSNPIRIKHIEQPTLFSTEIIINQENSQMPIFSWDINSVENNAIFFQVLSTTNDDLISGTYTFENQFQYYNTSNVVLNITNGIPPDLISGQTYKFTVMDVSEDNWVNQLLIIQFVLE